MELQVNKSVKLMIGLQCPSYLAPICVVKLWKFDLFLSFLIHKINKNLKQRASL